MHGSEDKNNMTVGNICSAYSVISVHKNKIFIVSNVLCIQKRLALLGPANKAPMIWSFESFNVRLKFLVHVDQAAKNKQH